ncbi:MAG: hypothetical protein JSR80_03570 [Verrucomicrobia bacterium]|nr:hypothetical protein [Verrucomicrobiota bacterium]
MVEPSGSQAPKEPTLTRPPPPPSQEQPKTRVSLPSIPGVPKGREMEYMSLTAVLNETRNLLTDLFSTLTQTVLPAMNQRMQALTNAMNALSEKMHGKMCSWCLNKIQGEQQALSNMVQQLQSVQSSVTSGATTFETYIGNIINAQKAMLDSITSNM